MAEHSYSILSIMIIMILGLVSPGPDFVIVLKNSMTSRKYGIFTALGVALGTLVHVTYISLGLGLVIRQNAWMFLLLKYFGSCYLIYIGYKSFVSSSNTPIITDNKKRKLNIIKAMSSGFLTNALNPKAMLFFIGLFTFLLEQNTDFYTIALYGAMIFVQTFIWFTLVALLFSNTLLQSKFALARSWIDKTIGVVFIAFGVKLILTKI